MIDNAGPMPTGPKKGDRACCFLADHHRKLVYMFGAGEFQGSEIPPDDILFMGQSANQLNMPIAKVLLDSGQTIWGCECHVLPEDWLEHLKEKHSDATVIDLDISEVRKQGDVMMAVAKMIEAYDKNDSIQKSGTTE